MSAADFISSRSNPRFKRLRALVDDTREPRRQGRTIADGIHLVASCLDHGAVVEQLLMSESGQENDEIKALINRAAGADCVIIRDALFRELSGVSSPTGVAAVIAIPPQSDGLLSGDALLLDAVQDAGNVGTLLRTAAAAGVKDVVLGNGCAGAWTPRVLRAGQGAHFGLRIREQVDLVALLETASYMSVATVVDTSETLYELDLTVPVIWIFGNEGAGISLELMTHAQRRVSIPMKAGTESLNVASAAAICMFEAFRQRRLLVMQ
jgi:TrmH family RNA methyltransferase